MTGGFNGSELVKWGFYLLAGLSLLFAIVITIRKLFGLDKRKGKEKSQKPAVDGQELDTVNNQYEPVIEEEVLKKHQTPEASPPKYFRVKDNKDLVMAEYDDKVELYRLENGKMIKIRTDYKTER